jgi:hypothetical protein
MEEQRPPVIVKTFTGETQEVAAQQFAADAAEAVKHGYTPASQAWDGTTLTVIYQHQAPEPPAASPEPPQPRSSRSPAPSPEPPRYVVQRSDPVGSGLGQGFGFGIGCVLFLIALVVGCAFYVSSGTT